MALGKPDVVKVSDININKKSPAFDRNRLGIKYAGYPPTLWGIYRDELILINPP
jgi:hypothetical protein